jgi:hypothetical protein
VIYTTKRERGAQPAAALEQEWRLSDDTPAPQPKPASRRPHPLLTGLTPARPRRARHVYEGAEYPRFALVISPALASCARRVLVELRLSPSAFDTSPAVEPGCALRYSMIRCPVCPRTVAPRRCLDLLRTRGVAGSVPFKASSACWSRAASSTSGRNSASRVLRCWRAVSIRSDIARVCQGPHCMTDRSVRR